MAEKNNVFSGDRPDAIDHKNPPKPKTTGDKPTQPAPHPAFGGVRPDAIDHKNPPKPTPATTTPGLVAKLAVLILSLFLFIGNTQAVGTFATLTNNMASPISASFYKYPPLSLSGLTVIGTNSSATISGAGASWTGVILVNTNNNFAIINPFGAYTQNYCAYLMTNGHYIFYNPLTVARPDNLTNGPGWNTNGTDNITPANAFNASAGLAGARISAPGQLLVGGASVAGVNGLFTNFFPDLTSPLTNGNGYVLTETKTNFPVGGLGTIHFVNAFTLSFGNTNFYTNSVYQNLPNYLTNTYKPQWPANSGWLAVLTNYTVAPTSTPVYF